MFKSINFFVCLSCGARWHRHHSLHLLRRKCRFHRGLENLLKVKDGKLQREKQNQDFISWSNAFPLLCNAAFHFWKIVVSQFAGLKSSSEEFSIENNAKNFSLCHFMASVFLSSLCIKFAHSGEEGFLFLALKVTNLCCSYWRSTWI